MATKAKSKSKTSSKSSSTRKASSSSSTSKRKEPDFTPTDHALAEASDVGLNGEDATRTDHNPALDQMNPGFGEELPALQSAGEVTLPVAPDPYTDVDDTNPRSGTNRENVPKGQQERVVKNEDLDKLAK